MTQTPTVLVTGAGGFLGQAVCRHLAGLPLTLVPVRAKQFDLTRADDVDRCFRAARPDLLLHLACPYGGGGIGYAAAHPASLALGMVKMDSLLVEAAHTYGVRSIIGVGSVCAYPERITEFATPESHLWSGHPERVNASYGLAKRMQLTLLQAAATEWGINGAHLILANLYGPGDHFGTGLRGHVIPSTILKVDAALRAGAEEITAWGDGSPTREFLFIEDAAAAVATAVRLALFSTEQFFTHVDNQPVNVVSGEEVSIGMLVHLIADRMGFTGSVRWDTTKPNGQWRRHFSNARARTLLAWAPVVPLADGLARTINWYWSQQKGQA